MSEVFLKIVNMSISAGWLILAVLVLRFVLKKTPKWVNVLLWGIVAIRLICPFSIESALSLIPSAETIPLNIGMDTTPTIHSGISSINNVVNPMIAHTNNPADIASINPLQITIAIYANIWVLGILAMLIYTGISYLTLRRKLRTAVILRDNLFQCETVRSPFVLGILRPRIYLPYAMDGESLKHVIAHEQAHIRRKDHWWKPLGFLLLTIHWFNPLMWVAYILLCRDIELACDEKVIAELVNEQRADYTQALVACSINRRTIAACPLAFGEVGVKERVKSIMNYRKPTFWIIVAAIVVCVIVAVCFLTNPISEPVTEEWFDFTDKRAAIPWTEEMKCTITDFPGITFKYTPHEIVAATSWEDSDNAEKTILISGMPIWNAYFCDLTGDGLPEICSHVSEGSGIVDERIIIVDYANGVNYMMEDRGYHDYYLRMNDADGYLYVDKKIYNSDELVSSGRLVFENGYFQIDGSNNEPVTNLQAKILEIHDGYFLVEPIEGSWELSSASIIAVPMKNMEPSPEPEVGDILEIKYDGQIQETYLALISNVYRISVKQQAQTSSVSMIPTDTNLLGSHAGAVLVPIDGNVYRYELTEGNPEGVTIDELLYTFTEETHIEGIIWEVYSLKEYPDKTAVLMLSGTNSTWLCRYSPPGRCSDAALANAINAGYVVMEDGIATHGQDVWKEFYDQTQEGEAASVTVVHYGTLDPDRCDSVYYQIFNQDYPYLNVYMLTYNGEIFTLSYGDINERQTRTYEYLMKYDTTDFYSMSSKLPEGRYDYVLTHDNKVTWEQLFNGLVSSQMDAYIDHYSIYSEYK